MSFPSLCAIGWVADTELPSVARPGQPLRLRSGQALRLSLRESMDTQSVLPASQYALIL